MQVAYVHHGDKGGGQILLVTGGCGWYQEWGKEAKELHAGDSWFAHIAIEIPGENTSNEWMEPVTEEQYGNLK